MEQKGKTVVWTLTSNGYKYYTLNLLKSLQKAGVSWTLKVICADKAAHAFFKREGYNCSLWGAGEPVQLNMSLFGSRNFQKMNRMKLDILDSYWRNPEITQCVYLDGDIVVYKDFLQDLSGHDLAFQCDEYDPAIICNTRCPNICTGMIAWRQSYLQIKWPDLFKISPNDPSWLEKPEDQIWVNRQLRRTGIPFISLPRNLFLNWVFVRQMYDKRSALLLHYNYRVGEVKKGDMMRNGDWLIPY